MLYSDIKLYLAGVKVPYMNCTCNAGSAQAMCVFSVPENDRAKQEASILARIKFEGIPVTITGTDYNEVTTVLLDGVCSFMNVRYDPDQGVLSLDIQAVSRIIAAMTGIRYSELSLGSMYASAESAVAASVGKQINENTGAAKNVVTAPTPVTSLNSIIFMEKLVTGQTRPRIKNPSDIIEFSIDNILKAQNVQTASTKSLREVLAVPAQKPVSAVTPPSEKALDNFMKKCYASGTGSPQEELDSWYRGTTITSVTPGLLSRDTALADFIAEQSEVFPDINRMSVDMLMYCQKIKDETLKKLNIYTWRNYAGNAVYSRPEVSFSADSRVFPEYGTVTCAVADIFIQVAECLAVIKDNNSYPFLEYCITNSQTELAVRLFDLFRKHLNDTDTVVQSFNTFLEKSGYTTEGYPGIPFFTESNVTDALQAKSASTDYIKIITVAKELNTVFRTMYSSAYTDIQSILQDYRAGNEISDKVTVVEKYLFEDTQVKYTFPGDSQYNILFKHIYENRSLVYTGVEGDTADYSRLTLFDVLAARKLYETAAFNKIFLYNMFRNPPDDPDYIFPTLKLKDYQAFRNIIDNTASSGGNVTATLFQILTNLYNQFLFKPVPMLNKFVAQQDNKSGTFTTSAGFSGVFDPDKSVSELMIITRDRPGIVPMCNVIYQDTAVARQIQYSPAQNRNMVELVYGSALEALTPEAAGVPRRRYVVDALSPDNKVRLLPEETGSMAYAFSSDRNKVFTNSQMYQLQDYLTVSIQGEVTLMARLMQGSVSAKQLSVYNPKFSSGVWWTPKDIYKDVIVDRIVDTPSEIALSAVGYQETSKRITLEYLKAFGSPSETRGFSVEAPLNTRFSWVVYDASANNREELDKIYNEKYLPAVPGGNYHEFMLMTAWPVETLQQAKQDNISRDSKTVTSVMESAETGKFFSKEVSLSKDPQYEELIDALLKIKTDAPEAGYSYILRQAVAAGTFNMTHTLKLKNDITGAGPDAASRILFRLTEEVLTPALAVSAFKAVEGLLPGSANSEDRKLFLAAFIASQEDMYNICSMTTDTLSENNWEFTPVIDTDKVSESGKEIYSNIGFDSDTVKPVSVQVKDVFKTIRPLLTGFGITEIEPSGEEIPPDTVITTLQQAVDAVSVFSETAVSSLYFLSTGKALYGDRPEIYLCAGTGTFPAVKTGFKSPEAFYKPSGKLWLGFGEINRDIEVSYLKEEYVTGNALTAIFGKDSVPVMVYDLLPGSDKPEAFIGMYYYNSGQVSALDELFNTRIDFMKCVAGEKKADLLVEFYNNGDLLANKPAGITRNTDTGGLEYGFRSFTRYLRIIPWTQAIEDEIANLIINSVPEAYINKCKTAYKDLSGVITWKTLFIDLVGEYCNSVLKKTPAEDGQPDKTASTGTVPAGNKEIPLLLFTSDSHKLLSISGAYGQQRKDRLHNGVDVKVSDKSRSVPLLAPCDGRVQYYWNPEGYGLYCLFFPDYRTPGKKCYPLLLGHMEVFRSLSQSLTGPAKMNPEAVRVKKVEALKDKAVAVAAKYKDKDYLTDTEKLDYAAVKTEEVIKGVQELILKTPCRVKKGVVIGFMGNSGEVSTGKHLHLTVFNLNMPSAYNSSTDLKSLLTAENGDIMSSPNEPSVLAARTVNPATVFSSDFYPETGYEGSQADNFESVSGDLSRPDFPAEPSDDIIESIVRTKGYEILTGMYASYNPGGISLPYLDPYMAEHMPMAVVYRDDIILTVLDGITVSSDSNGNIRQDLTLSPGLSVRKLMYLILSSVKQSSDFLRQLKESPVFPGSFIDQIKKTLHNPEEMEKQYHNCFGRSGFIFDWRKAVIITAGDNEYSLYDLAVMETVPEEIMKLNPLDILKGTDAAWLRFDISAVVPGFRPYGEESLMLDERAWLTANRYTTDRWLDGSYAPKFKKNQGSDDLFTLTSVESSTPGLYETDLYTLTAGNPVTTPPVFYDWASKIKKLLEF